MCSDESLYKYKPNKFMFSLLVFAFLLSTAIPFFFLLRDVVISSCHPAHAFFKAQAATHHNLRTSPMNTTFSITLHILCIRTNPIFFASLPVCLFSFCFLPFARIQSDKRKARSNRTLLFQAEWTC